MGGHNTISNFVEKILLEVWASKDNNRQLIILLAFPGYIIVFNKLYDYQVWLRQINTI